MQDESIRPVNFVKNVYLCSIGELPVSFPIPDKFTMLRVAVSSMNKILVSSDVLIPLRIVILDEH